MHWGDMPGWGWAGWFVPSLTTLLLIGVLVTLIVLLMRRPGERAPDTAGQILADRFARGDIDEDEYQRRRQVLRR
jgi:putative membrane protein